MARLIVVKAADGSLRPASPVDQDEFDKWAAGESKSVEIKGFKPRNLAMHKKYWALVDLAKEYWRPTDREVIAYEIKLFRSYVNFLNNNGINGSSLNGSIKHFLKLGIERRKKNAELTPVTKEAFHRYIKIKLNHYELMRNERGVFKSTKSISFGSMSQEAFEAFYKEAFDICWNAGMKYVFEHKSQAEQAIAMQLLSFT